MNHIRGAFQLINFENVLYAFGGSDSSHKCLDSVECFDSVTNSWKTIKTKIPTPRCNFAAAIYKEKIYLIGGNTHYNGDVETNIVECYDPKENVWTKVTNITLLMK